MSRLVIEAEVDDGKMDIHFVNGLIYNGHSEQAITQDGPPDGMGYPTKIYAGMELTIRFLSHPTTSIREALEPLTTAIREIGS